MTDYQLSTVSVRCCLKCGKDISYRHGRAKFCSEKCHDIFHGWNQEPILNCQYCGKDISDTQANQKYCSYVCKRKARTVRAGGTPLARIEPRIRPVIDGKKQCTKCNEWKLIEEFRFINDRKAHESRCLSCGRENSRISMSQRIALNRDGYNEYMRKWKQNNKEKIQAYRAKEAEKLGKAYRPDLPPHVAGVLAKTGRMPVLKTDAEIAAIKEKIEENKAKRDAERAFKDWMGKKTDQEVADYYKRMGKPWLNPRLTDAEQFRSKYKNCPEFAISERLRRQIRKAKTNDSISALIHSALHRNGRSSKVENMLGYSIADLRFHLERQFTKKMSWDKFMNGEIHIDHIIPKAAFDLSDPDQWCICWGLPNLRPLWAKDNLEKRAKVLTLL